MRPDARGNTQKWVIYFTLFHVITLLYRLRERITGTLLQVNAAKTESHADVIPSAPLSHICQALLSHPTSLCFKFPMQPLHTWKYVLMRFCLTAEGEK